MPSRMGSALRGAGVGGAHLVKEAILADELLSGLGVDGDGEPYVCHQELGEEPEETSEKAWPAAPA